MTIFVELQAVNFLLHWIRSHIAQSNMTSFMSSRLYYILVLAKTKTICTNTYIPMFIFSLVSASIMFAHIKTLSTQYYIVIIIISMPFLTKTYHEY